MVGFYGNIICQMKEKLYATSCYMVAMDFFAASNSYDFLNSTVKKSDGERVNDKKRSNDNR